MIYRMPEDYCAWFAQISDGIFQYLVVRTFLILVRTYFLFNDHAHILIISMSCRCPIFFTKLQAHAVRKYFFREIVLFQAHIFGIRVSILIARCVWYFTKNMSGCFKWSVFDILNEHAHVMNYSRILMSYWPRDYNLFGT